MSKKYSDLQFPFIKPHPWNKIFRPQTPLNVIDLVSKLLVYNPENRLKPMDALLH